MADQVEAVVEAYEKLKKDVDDEAPLIAGWEMEAECGNRGAGVGVSKHYEKKDRLESLKKELEERGVEVDKVDARIAAERKEKAEKAAPEPQAVCADDTDPPCPFTACSVLLVLVGPTARPRTALTLYITGHCTDMCRVFMVTVSAQ